MCTLIIGCAYDEPRASATTGDGQLSEVFLGVDESLILQWPEQAAAFRTGEIAFATSYLDGLVLVVDSLGSPLRTLGAVGQGPGEYQSVSWIQARGDTLLVGLPSGLIQGFSRDGQFLTQYPLRIQVTGYLIQMSGDTVVVAQPISTTDRFGLPFHLLSLAGDTLGSFGTEDRSFDAGTSGAGFLRLYRTIARASDSTFWSIDPYTYQIQLWSVKGELLSDARAIRDWMPELQDDESLAELLDEDRPAPRVRNVLQRADGKLLTFSERPTAEAMLSEPRSSGDERSVRLTDRMNLREQVIELVDPLTGQASAVMVNRGAYLMGFLNESLVWGLQRDGGVDRPVVLRMEWEADGGR